MILFCSCADVFGCMSAICPLFGIFQCLKKGSHERKLMNEKQQILTFEKYGKTNRKLTQGENGGIRCREFSKKISMKNPRDKQFKKYKTTRKKSL